MNGEHSSRVVGLVPRAVRLELRPCQVQPLVNELITRIEAHASSLREEHERHGKLSDRQLAEVGALVLEYRNLLAQLGGEREFAPRSATTLTTLVTATEVADDLSRACALTAVHDLSQLLEPPGNRATSVDLRLAGETTCAWAATLADLRQLDEDGPESILDV